MKLFTEGIVAIDGSKFKAVNNRDKNFTKRKIQVWMAGIATLVPKPLTSNSRADGRFDKRDFVYDRHRDEYRCPAGQIAIRRYTTVERGKTLHRYWTSSCPSCTIKAQCTLPTHCSLGARGRPGDSPGSSG
jgi:hypothetical protein